ncbi:MAG: hypothetical protein CMD35_05825 [Flavobacteriales bacterium]|nr:hypothetical protein [Flavobacteriales bacterium]|tara:strand:- start:4298 stop:4699 length:402 start_codon:yes stop_codon:yes gene_type:complete
MQVTIRQKGGVEYLYADISLSGIRVRGTIGISVPKKSWDVKNQRVKKDDETTFLVSTIKNKIFENIQTLQREGRVGKSEIRNILEKVKGETVEPVDDEVLKEMELYFKLLPNGKLLMFNYGQNIRDELGRVQL